MESINISITKETYAKLKKIKRPNESFSNVIDRLISERKNPFMFEGIWIHWDEADLFEEGCHL